MAYKWAAAVGEEFYNKGCQVALGPGLNVNRLEQGGRNWEYISGEDPFLGYVMGYHAVTGMQDQNVMANVKHFVANN